jgi:hypothetical protein
MKRANDTIATRFRRGFLLTAGFILSPASWWNDAFVNAPIAWVIASLVHAAAPGAYAAAFVVAYWLTNIAGFALLHAGGVPFLPRRRASAVLLLAVSVAYTVGFFVLFRNRVIPPIPFGRR